MFLSQTNLIHLNPSFRLAKSPLHLLQSHFSWWKVRKFPFQPSPPHDFLKAGWWFQPLWQIVNWDDETPNIWKKKCSSHHQPDGFPTFSHLLIPHPTRPPLKHFASRGAEGTPNAHQQHRSGASQVHSTATLQKFIGKGEEWHLAAPPTSPENQGPPGGFEPRALYSTFCGCCSFFLEP